MRFFIADVIRTQPYDLLSWSAAYFRCIANDIQPPTKSQFEDSTDAMIESRSLTVEYLKTLVKQVNSNKLLADFFFISFAQNKHSFGFLQIFSDWQRLFRGKNCTSRGMESTRFATSESMFHGTMLHSLDKKNCYFQ